MRESEYRPVLRIKNDSWDYVFLTGSYLMVLSMWIYVIWLYPTLPETIAIHFDSNGEPNGYGSKSTLFFIPVLVSVLVIFLGVICRYPHKFNYMAVITTENAEWQYRKALRLIRYLQFFIPAIFSFIVYKEIKGAFSQTSKLDFWFIPILIFGIMIPTVFTVYKSLVKK